LLKSVAKAAALSPLALVAVSADAKANARATMKVVTRAHTRIIL
jgi:hypothetical protein